MVERAFHHRLGTGFAVFLQEVLFPRTGIDADTHGAAMILGRLPDFTHAVGAADIRRLDAQAGGARLGGVDGALVVKLAVGYDRHRNMADDFLWHLSLIFRRARNAPAVS